MRAWCYRRSLLKWLLVKRHDLLPVDICIADVFSVQVVAIIVKMMPCWGVAGRPGVVGMPVAFFLRGRRLVNRYTMPVAGCVWHLFVYAVFISSVHRAGAVSMQGMCG